jgi:hypothetical protein
MTFCSPPNVSSATLAPQHYQYLATNSINIKAFGQPFIAIVRLYCGEWLVNVLLAVPLD